MQVQAESHVPLLTLVSLLILVTTIVLTGGALSGAALSFMRPAAQSGRSSVGAAA